MTQKNAAMKDNWGSDIIPRQATGSSSVTSSHIKCRNNYLVNDNYMTASRRLLNVNQWHLYAGKGTAIFQLTDKEGTPINRVVNKNDYIRISIPGPGNPEGDGNDWVQVQETGDRAAGEHQLTYLTVRAATNPMHIENETAHFFDQAATSTFIVRRDQLTITAAVYGRNEHPNLKAGTVMTSIRNWFIYLGARLGFSNLQWKKLTRGWLNFN